MGFGLVIVGNEMLTGKRQDQHLPAVIKALAERGLELDWVRMVGDDMPRLVGQLREAMASGDVVFSCGGIGATPDDLTRAAAANAAGVKLVRHLEGAALLEQLFAEKAYPTRIQMVDFPEGSRLIPNPVNQVPGFSLGDHHFVPGFPGMAWPMIEWVLDTYYQDRRPDAPPVEILIEVPNVPESALVPLMEQIISNHPSIRLSCLPHHDGHTAVIEFGLRGAADAVAAAQQEFTAGLDALGHAWQEKLT